MPFIIDIEEHTNNDRNAKATTTGLVTILPETRENTGNDAAEVLPDVRSPDVRLYPSIVSAGWTDGSSPLSSVSSSPSNACFALVDVLQSQTQVRPPMLDNRATTPDDHARSSDVHQALADVRPAPADNRPPSADVHHAPAVIRPALADVRPTTPDDHAHSSDVAQTSADARQASTDVRSPTPNVLCSEANLCAPLSDVCEGLSDVRSPAQSVTHDAELRDDFRRILAHVEANEGTVECDDEYDTIGDDDGPGSLGFTSDANLDLMTQEFGKVMDLAQAVTSKTCVSVSQVFDHWTSTNTCKHVEWNLWNMYVAYFKDHEEQELALLPERTFIVFNSKKL